MIENVKALAVDIDQTLIEKGGDVMPITKRAIEKLHENGVLFGIASGRPLDERTLSKAEEWGFSFPFDFAIGMNGGDLWDRFHEGISHYYLLPRQDVREILDFLEPLDVNAIIYENAYDEVLALRMDWFMEDSIRRNHSHVTIGDPERLSRNDTGKIEVHYTPSAKEELFRAISKHESDRWKVVKTFEGTVEFIHPSLHKGVALRMFAQRNGIDMDEILAFGDEQNDIGMLREAGWGVCLKNGSEQTKAFSDDITEYPVTEDGMGRYLFENILKEAL